MKRLSVCIAFIFSSVCAFAQTGAVQGFCTQGAVPAVTSGSSSANTLQGVIAGCTVTVYLHGTTTLATIYRDGNNTPLANPFTANLAGATNAGGWLFYAATSQGVDIFGSGGGGNPACTTQPKCYAVSTSIAVAAYPSSGAGCSPNTIANGCTGATTQLGASGTLGISGPNANVSGYGAVGDCAPTGSTGSCTDNCTALQAAIDNGATKGIPVYLPANVGQSSVPTVYYTSCALNPKGVSIYGPPGGFGGAFYPAVSVRGAPGKDVFDVADPTTGGYSSPAPTYVWQDFGIIIDDSVDVSASNVHRKPGKTCNDITATSSSAVITSTSQCEFNQGDVGQAVSLTDGTNTLATTISSVSSITSATLAATWPYPTHTSSTIYVSVMGLSTSVRVGNCGLAYDDYTSAGSTGPDTSVFRNLRLVTVSGTEQNNSCAFFFQGAGGQPYASEFKNIFYRTYWGFTAVEADAASHGNNGALGDLNHFDNVVMDSTIPLVTYDGDFTRWNGGQMAFAEYGPQILNYGAPSNEYVASDWHIENEEWESQGFSSGLGWRIDGKNHIITGTALASTNFPAQWDATNSKCESCYGTGTSATINLTGGLNKLQFSDGADSVLSVNDTGFGNLCSRGRQYNPFDAQEPSLYLACSAVNSRQNIAFAHTSDFVSNGNETTTYNNQADLWLWPQDLTATGAAPPAFYLVVPDSASETGTHLNVFSGEEIGFNYLNTSTIIIGPANAGPNLPATEVHVCWKAKADSGSGGVFFAVFANSTNIGEVNPTLTTTYSTSCFDVDFTTYSGDLVTFIVYTPTVQTDLAWISVHPWADSINSIGPINGSVFDVAGSPLATGNLADWTNSGVANGNVPVWNSGTGKWTPGSGTGSIPGGVLGSVPYQSAPGVTAVSAANTSSSTLCFTETGTGTVGAIPTWGSCAGSAATAFSALTSSTNTSAAMLVGSGASLDSTGTGTIDANLANGAVLPASAGFTSTNSSRQLVAAAYTPANCTAGTTGSDCLQLTSGLVPVGNIPTAIPIANIGSAGLSGTAPVSIASTGAISMHVADASDNGYLSSTDWSTFNGKQAALSLIKGTYVDGDFCAYTALGTLLNCNVTPGGTGTVTDGSGTTTTPEFAESTGTAHVIQYRTASQALGDMGAQAALSLLAGTYTNGDWCSYASSGTLLNCNNAVPQVNLSLIKGTYVDGDYCTYTASGTVLNCNSTPSGSGTVTSFSAGNLSPLFTTSVATATSTPALTFSLSNAAQNSVLAGPISGGAGAPSYQTAPTISAANMTSFPTLNQNTTGSAAKWTTARNLAGNSVDGSANVAFANKFIVQGTSDSGLSGPQFLGALGTGIVKNTTTTGVLSIAAAADVYGLWSGSCSSSTYLRGDGACATPSGSSGLSGMTAGQVPIAATASTVTSSEALAGAGAAIVTGPASSTSGDAVVYTGTSGQTADAGFAPAPSIGSNTGETSGWTLAANTVYRFTGSGASNATTPASISAGFIASIQNTGTAAVTVVTGGPTLHCEPSSCVVQIGASALITTDANGTDFDEIASNANGSAFGSLANASTINNSNWSGTVLAAGNGGTGIANTATLTLGSSNQNWATLGTGIVKNTTTTGAITDAVAADVYGLWSGTCNSSSFLRGDGACAAPGGSGTVNSGTASHLAYYATSTTAVSDMGADFTFATHTLTGGASAILDLSAASVTAGLKIPGAAGGAPTADDFIAFNTTTHAMVHGSNGTTIVDAAAATGTNTSTACSTHNWVSTISSVAAPTCTQPAVADVTGAAPTASPTFTGTVTYPLIATTTNCAAAGSAASPSLVACSAAPSGSFSCATNASTATCVISTTAVTANSRIFVQPSAAEGANLSVTCNTTSDTGLVAPRLASKSAGTSFTINLGTFSTNPECFNYWIEN